MASEPDDDDRAELVEAAQHRRERLRTCMAQLESAIAAPAPGREDEWRAHVAGVLDDLGSAFEHHCEETDAAGGLFEQVLEDAPRLAHAISRLRDEHTAVRKLVADLQAGSAAGGDDIATRLRDGGIELLTLLVRHRQHGADLLYEAYMVDVAEAD